LALPSTIYTLTIDLSDVDRGVYETLELRVARHPSETGEYMVTRVLAYALEYQDGIAMTDGVSSGDEPAVLVRDLTGRITAWIEVGMPDAGRLHRARKLAPRVAVYTHRDVRQLLAQYAGEKIHRADDIKIFSFDRAFIDALAGAIDRRTALSLQVSDRELYVHVGDRAIQGAITEHRIG
jgi:uncharacterized protein YaeQ